MSTEGIAKVDSSLIKGGEKYLYPEKIEKWNTDISEILNGEENSTTVVSAVLVAMENLSNGMPFDNVDSELHSQLENDDLAGTYGTARTLILDYSKRGPEFEQFLIDKAPEQVSPFRVAKVQEILIKNAEYEKNSIIRGENQRKRTRKTDESFIRKNYAMKVALGDKIKTVDKEIVALKGDKQEFRG